MGDIPNTIPPNQLKNHPNITDDISSQDTLFMSQFDNKKQSLDELENISFNYENNTGGNNTANNTANNTINEPTQQNEEIFDELAMLCSGQFKENTQKKKTNQSKPHDKDIYKFSDDDDDEECDEEERIIRKKKKMEEIDEEENEEEGEDDDDDEDEEEEDTKEPEDDDDDDEEIEEEEEEEDEEIEIKDEETRPKTIEQKLKLKKKKKEELKKALEKDGFFEEEAVLSGDEQEEDEDYDADSADDSIVCSGDEDNLPSDSELKEQLGRIYLKDKMDEEKRQLRLIKEMYLNEEDSGKNARRKNFRWKHIDDNLGIRYHSNSSDEEEEEEADEDKKSSFFKSVANGDWRSNRHEREQFVHQKLKKKENLLSDEEDEEEDDEEEKDENNCLRIFGSSANQGNQLLKKGQMLLKKTTFLKPTAQKKRAFDDEKGTNQSRIIIEKKIEPKFDQKFSFLNRDKSYLNRISSYVNKNLNDKVNFKTIKPNNMIFSIIDPVPEDTNDENKNLIRQNTKPSQTFELNNQKNNSEPKRAKYDYSQSIFNHL